MLRMTPVFLVLLSSAALVACPSESPPEAASPAATPEASPAATPEAKPAPVETPTPAPASVVTPKAASAAPAVREKPSEEACKSACKRILGLAVEEVPEVRRRGAQSFMDAVVDEACPDKCMRSGTRASVGCVNAAKTYAEAKACPGTP